MARRRLRRRSWEAALFAGDTEAIEQRIALGVRPAGAPLLHLAVRVARDAATLALVLRHTPPDARDARQATALHYATRRDFAVLLLDAGADVMARDAALRTPLHYLLDGTPKVSFSDGELDTATLLLERGADPNAQDAGGASPLHAALAERTGIDGIVHEWHALIAANARAALAPALTLIRHGAHLDLPDGSGNTPEALAIRAGVPPGALRELAERGGPYR